MANMQELLSQRFEAQKQKLVSMDIVAVAESLGMTLRPGSSGTYYWEEHDSFHIYPNTNTFRWWSRSIGTNTIDLVQVVQEEMTGHKPSFREAATFLETGHFDNVTVQPIVKEPFEYYLERYEHPDFNIGKQYLKEERGLSDETIDTFLASGNLATATRKKGDYFEPVIVFKSRDNDGKMIGASLQGIVENRVQHPERGRLKQMMKNSDGTAGFSLDIGNPKRLVFAEAPIDLMSYYELHKDELQDVKLVAMDGLKKSVISRYVADMLTDGKYSQTMSTEQIRGALDALNKTTNILQEHPYMITLAVDNDEKGQNFVKDLQEEGIPVVADLPPRQEAQNKMDWNDYLKQMKKENTPMENQTMKKTNKDQLALFDNLADLTPSKAKKKKQAKEVDGDLTSYGSFRIDDEFLENRYGTKPEEEETKKAPEQLQEATVSISEQHKKIGHKLGDLPDNRQEAAPLPEATQSQPLNDLLPSQTQNQSLLHFTISNPNQSRRKAGYHLATKRDLDRVNNYAQGLQEAAQWYRDNLANSTISYVYKDETIKSPLIVQITFEEKQFMHLTGLFPLKDGQTAEKTLQDFAEGNGDFDHLMIANRGAAFQKLQVLPEIKDMLRTDAFYFDYVADIPRLHNIDMETAIKSDEGGFVTAFRSNEEGLYPASLLELTPDLLDEFTQAPPGKTILGIYRDRDGQLEQVAINKEYVKDGGQKLFRILQENKAKEEDNYSLEQTKAALEEYKDSDGDGLTDDEEIALGTNPYSPDTDGDGILDSVEKAGGTDATNPSDTPDSRKEEMNKRDLTLSEMIKAKNTALLNQHLQEGIKDYFDSDNYKNFLEGMSHFNNYSVRNIQLIKAQLPEASMVTSFNEWKKRNGHVNKGEKALYVQAPVTVIKKDADGKPVINADTGEKETLTYFKPVPVFDISQVSPVEGKELDLPKMGGAIPSQINKEYYQNVYRALRDISQKENGIPIRFRELEKSDGFYNPKTNEITIKKGMTYEQTLSTLIHEMVHSELHNKKSLTERFEGKLTRSSKELQAESIAYVVSNHLGFDTSGDSFAYLASWSQEPDGLENLKAQLEIVQEEASSLMKRIDKHLEKYQSLTVSKDEKLTENQKRELEKTANPFYQSLKKAKGETVQTASAKEEQSKKVNRPMKQ